MNKNKRRVFLFLIALGLWCVGGPVWAESSFAEWIHYHPSAENKVGYLALGRERPIDTATQLEFTLALEHFRREGVRFVLLHLNTPGGEVFASTRMAELLEEMDHKYHIPIVAVIDNWALSAGAMLAYASRFIVVSSQAVMGAAEPVMAGGSGQMESAPEKINSALRAEFRTLAKSYGRDPLIAEAMVDKDLIVVARKGKVIALESASAVKAGDVMIASEGKLLTLDAEQLLHWQIAQDQLPSMGTLFDLPFFSQIPDINLVHYKSWKVQFFAFLMHPAVASLLMMGLMIGVYMELQSPGVGAPAALAASCLGLILLSQFAAQSLPWLEVIFILFGVALLFIELWVLPGFGLMGGMGVLFLIGGLFSLLLPSWHATEWSWNVEGWNLAAQAFIYRLEWLLGGLIITLFVMVVLGRWITPRLMEKNRMILHSDQEGSVAGCEKTQLPNEQDCGIAMSALRPGGKIKIGQRIYDASSQGEWIDKGSKVCVSKIQGGSIIVFKKE